ncbi:hypothetical protein IWQ61_000694 [Dispira simplex]|nr:hypothetical protein IWQ61_000694 [Dispira simplex]
MRCVAFVAVTALALLAVALTGAVAQGPAVPNPVNIQAPEEVQGGPEVLTDPAVPPADQGEGSTPPPPRCPASPQ